MDIPHDGTVDDDRQQQVEQCLARVEPSATAQREALERALALTGEVLGAPEHGPGPRAMAGATGGDHPAPGGGGGSQGDEWRRWFRAARLRILQHLERLETVLALNSGAWNPAAFSSLRDCTAAEAAMALAAAGRLSALPLLLQRHPRALLPSALEVLAAIPETIDPKQYVQLLRQVVTLQQPPPLERAADWVESAETAAELRQGGEYALLLATEAMVEANMGWHPPTQRQLAHWVCQRAQLLDAATGQLPHAIDLLEAGQVALHYGEVGIGSLMGTAQELLPLIKLASSRQEGGSGTWRTDLQQYAALAPPQRLALLLGLLSSGDGLASDLSLHVVPFLSRLHSSSSNEAVDPQVVLRQALEKEAARRLSWVVRLVQCEARQRAAFSTAAQLAKTAGACCYAATCMADDAWELMSSMLKAAGDAVWADEELEEEKRRAAVEALDVVKGHVTAARLFTKHGLTTPVSVVRDADRGAALRLLRTLLARVSRTKNSELRWVEVWMDLRTVQQHGLSQLTEEEIRSEFCRALLRVGQYRLCRSYLQGLPLEAAEQLVLSAAREVFLSASSMNDKAVKQAKECLSLLPHSAPLQEQLAGIAAAEQLGQQLGLDLPPLQLQQLLEQVAGGSGKVLEQLVSDHPQLVAADSGTLMQVSAALGVAPQQQRLLLLRAAEAAHVAGDVAQAQSLLLMLAEQHHKPAWKLAAAVAAAHGCSSGARRRLLLFALAAAPAEELFSLLEQWEAADSSGCRGGWEPAPAVEPAAACGSGSGGVSDQHRRQQLWLAQQLQHFLGGISGSGSSSGCGGVSGEAAALGCLMALGHRGLVLWEHLLQEQQQPPLTHYQRRRALLLGFTAAALQALQPADTNVAAVAVAVAAAEARLAASPAELLHLLQRKQQHQHQQAGASSGPGSGAGDELALSDAVSEGCDADNSAPGTVPLRGAGGGAITPALMVAAAAAERFHGLLLSMAAAKQLQQQLPGVDTTAALAGNGATRRHLVLQLATAAGTPAAFRGAAVDGGSSSSISMPPIPSLPLRPQRQDSRLGAGSPSPDSSGPVPWMVNRKKSEAWRADGEAGTDAAAAAAAADPSLPSPFSAAAAGGWAQQQFSTDAAAEMVQQALQLAAQCDVAPWEVHLVFIQALLLHSQQLWQQEQQTWGSVQQLLETSMAVLLSEPQAAAALLGVLLRSVWQATDSRCPRHLSLCLHLAQRTTTVLTVASAGGAAAETWQHLTSVLAACLAASEQLQQAAANIDAKLFLQPVVQQMAATLPAGNGGDGDGSELQSTAVSPAALSQQLLLHCTGSNAAALAAAVARLEQQQGLLGGDSYPCSGSIVFLALFCHGIAKQFVGRGSPDPAALQQSLKCLRHLNPAHVAAAAAFAATGGPCPFALPPSSDQLVPAELQEELRVQLLATALQVLDSSSLAAAGEPQLQQQIRQLWQRHALLAASSCIAAACPNASRTQLSAAREAALSLQQAALAAAAVSVGTDDGAEGAGSGMLDGCLQQLLTTGCPATAVLRATAVLQALQQQPGHAPQEAQALLVQPAAAAAAQAAVAAAASSAISAALSAMSGRSSASEEQLSPGDAVQNLFALLCSLHQTELDNSSSGEEGEGSTLAAVAEAEAVAALRLLVWQHLQQQAASYDGSGGAAASEAHVQVLELLGSVGSSSMWPGWVPPDLPPAGSAAAGEDGNGGGGGVGAFSHLQVLLFTRTVAALAVEWPAAVQECRLSVADFTSTEAAEAALLRLAAAAEEAEQLRLLLRLLAEMLNSAFATELSAAAANSPSAAAGESGSEDGSTPALVPLHRVWCVCLCTLLPLGDLAGVLAALDEQRGQQQQQEQPGLPLPAALVSEQEAAALLEAADTTQGSAAAAAVALLLPYPRLQRERWQLLLQACSTAGSTATDLAAAVPALAPLLLLAVQRQPALLVELVNGGNSTLQQLFKLLMGASLLQQQWDPGYIAPLGSGSLTLRMAVAAAGTAQLAAARQYSAAGWLAMQACATPRLLQVLDGSRYVLQQLLRSCSTGSAIAAGALMAAGSLAAGGGDGSGVAVPEHAAALLQALPEQCDQALAQLTSDLQLA